MSGTPPKVQIDGREAQTIEVIDLGEKVRLKVAHTNLRSQHVAVVVLVAGKERTPLATATLTPSQDSGQTPTAQMEIPELSEPRARRLDERLELALYRKDAKTALDALRAKGTVPFREAVEGHWQRIDDAGFDRAVVARALRDKFGADAPSGVPKGDWEDVAPYAEVKVRFVSKRHAWWSNALLYFFAALCGVAWGALALWFEGWYAAGSWAFATLTGGGPALLARFTKRPRPPPWLAHLRIWPLALTAGLVALAVTAVVPRFCLVFRGVWPKAELSDVVVTADLRVKLDHSVLRGIGFSPEGWRRSLVDWLGTNKGTPFCVVTHPPDLFVGDIRRCAGAYEPQQFVPRMLGVKEVIVRCANKTARIKKALFGTECPKGTSEGKDADCEFVSGFNECTDSTVKPIAIFPNRLVDEKSKPCPSRAEDAVSLSLLPLRDLTTANDLARVCVPDLGSDRLRWTPEKPSPTDEYQSLELHGGGELAFPRALLQSDASGHGDGLHLTLLGTDGAPRGDGYCPLATAASVRTMALVVEEPRFLERVKSDSAWWKAGGSTTSLLCVDPAAKKLSFVGVLRDSSLKEGELGVSAPVGAFDFMLRDGSDRDFGTLHSSGAASLVRVKVVRMFPGGSSRVYSSDCDFNPPTSGITESVLACLGPKSKIEDLVLEQGGKKYHYVTATARFELPPSLPCPYSVGGHPAHDGAGGCCKSPPSNCVFHPAEAVSTCDCP